MSLLKLVLKSSQSHRKGVSCLETQSFFCVVSKNDSGGVKRCYLIVLTMISCLEIVCGHGTFSDDWFVWGCPITRCNAKSCSWIGLYTLATYSFSLSLSLSEGNFPFAESVLRFVLSRSSRADKFILLYRTSISLVQARRKEAKSTKVNTHQ